MKRRRRVAPHHHTARISSHFTREGTPKNAYRTRTEALSAAQLAWTLHGVDLNAYRCDHCFQWHIGRDFRND